MDDLLVHLLLLICFNKIDQAKELIVVSILLPKNKDVE